MIIGTGVDIIEIDRFRDNHRRLAKKILCESEMAIYEATNLTEKKIRYIAKRFAAKEAVAKAFGCGIGESLGFKNIEISNNNNGKPIANVIGDTSILRNIDKDSLKTHISISDSDNQAIVFAIVEKTSFN